MNHQLTHEQRLLKNREYLKTLLSKSNFHASPLNTKLTANPFLKHEDKFKFITYQLNEYNKRIQQRQVTDPYEMLSYRKLYSMLGDLAQMETKQVQIKTLGEIYDWYKEQSKLITQRKTQGQIRYEMNKDYRDFLAAQQHIKRSSQVTKDQNEIIEKVMQQIPSVIIARLMQPYYFGNRTTFKQLDVPLRRLKEYKPKVINIATFIDAKQLSQPPQPPRVLYPMPQKHQPKEDDEEQKEIGEENKQADGQANQVDGQGAQVVEGQEKKQEDNNQQPEQDLGGFGQEPEQPADDEPIEDVSDKLAPKNKLFTAAVSNIASSHKAYTGQYMHFKGRENTAERSLQMRYLKLQQQIIFQQRQDKVSIELAAQRARKKSKMVKDIQKKLEDMTHVPKFKFSVEEQKHQQKLSKEDQLRFGFSSVIRVKPKVPEIQLGGFATTTTLLPKIRDDSFSEKNIRRDRITSLKAKFSKMLNLSEYEEREAAPSMCQYSARKRGFSEIIRAHSKSKERLNQLDQVTRIKEKLTKNKIGVNIRALSQGLCLPDSQQHSVDVIESIFPAKQLMSNPFMVQTKKKKKKKK